MKSLLIVAMVVLLLVAGCASLGEAHKEDPPRTITGSDTGDWTLGIVIGVILTGITAIALGYGG